MIIVVMGVSGSGKTTIGTMLAHALRCPFLEGDSFHPQENIEKMARGVALTDSDRAPWLAAIRERILDSLNNGLDLIVACSALKREYRDFLGAGVSLTWVYLKGSEKVIRSRVMHRPAHFMHANMLASQFQTLEEPSDAIIENISISPDRIVREILAQLPK